ncbi:hypothetical protein KTJ63_02930 [Acinetobacter baumannii]|uniref:hypothetical protein n=1 Tax=Acinetobacter TaxID=469 RepID=UPI000165E4A8|nr:MULTISPECIES: hypothetical protein [Acinetobacter]MCT9545793.1 hypothetical protein [Acinetobacter baumannii]MDA3552164.1 hypothetical protein [Acinetobacter sp. AOR11_HL]CAM86188.1 hypothetical protein ABAYE1267 [Acinetobacter baumannii AYE]SSQ62763.1 Uncharacterised protein [Acinetobacter baumannii]HAV4984451.1 hypothetical protein [Acinetobacter baumannii]
MSNQKKHYYIAHATFKNANLANDADQQYNTTIDLDGNKLTKSFLKKLELHIVKDIESNWPNISVKDLRLNSISYLGEMTKEEFES